MKLRNPPRYGAVPLYRLIASVVAGDPVQPGDAAIHGNGRRDMLLTKYAGRRPLPTLEKKDTPHEPEDSPAEPEGDSRGGGGGAP